MRSNTVAGLAILFYVILIVVMAIGWVFNIIDMVDADTLGEVVARLVGVFFLPIGALLGFFW